MSWAKWIVLSFVLFASFIATLVAVCVRQDIGLVSPDYYKEELVYEAQMKRIGNVAAMIAKPDIRVGAGTVIIDFKQPLTLTRGELKLFCPSNSKMDRRFDLQLQTSGTQELKINALKPGMYRAKLFWVVRDKEFYHEQIIKL